MKHTSHLTERSQVRPRFAIFVAKTDLLKESAENGQKLFLPTKKSQNLRANRDNY